MTRFAPARKNGIYVRGAMQRESSVSPDKPSQLSSLHSSPSALQTILVMQFTSFLTLASIALAAVCGVQAEENKRDSTPVCSPQHPRR